MDQKSWAEGEDEAVSVNQRALIDKVLARYSGESTIFRELIQNSDDALASSVQLRFYTSGGAAREEQRQQAQSTALALDGADGGVPDLKTAEITRYVFKNDGIPFRPEDWARLKSIATGNPDESKIGAFGVGFYALFSVTESPLVRSGNKWMGFHWRDNGDQLFARSGPLPETPAASQSSFSKPWTSFTMDLRTPGVLPSSPLELARFLTTSLTFLKTVQKAEIFLDDLRLCLVEKELQGTEEMTEPIPLERRSPQRMMQVHSVDATGTRLAVSIPRFVYTSSDPPPPPPPASLRPTIAAASTSIFSFFRSSPVASAPPTPPPAPSPKLNQLEEVSSTLELKIVSAHVKVGLTSFYEGELERATKKRPPRMTKVDVVFAGKAAHEGQGVAGVAKGGRVDVFEGLRADLDGRGVSKLFIGHATGQTSGIGGHISGRFVPTVERESLDLVDKFVAVWNKELLWAAGFVCRWIYESECRDIAALWRAEGAEATDEVKDSLIGRGIHALRFFSFFNSTPSPTVARELESAFFSCSRNSSLTLVSNLGPFSALERIRMPHASLVGFVKGIPVVPSALLGKGGLMVEKLRARGMLKDVSLEDVVKELRENVLSEEEFVECAKWWIELSQNSRFDSTVKRKLSESAIFSVKATSTDPKSPLSTDRIIPLVSIKSFYNPRSALSSSLPLPSSTLPVSISKSLPLDKLCNALGLRELSVPEWIEFLISAEMSGSAEGVSIETNLTRNAHFSEVVLKVLAKAWHSLLPASQAKVCQLLTNVTCVPSRAGNRAGMVSPGQAYFPNVSLFPDLAIVSLPSGSDIKGPMERLLIALGARRHVDLALLFSSLNTLGDKGQGWTVVELTRYLVSVRETLTAQEKEKLKLTPAFAVETTGQRLAPSEIYEPSEELRQLGLPILDWIGTKWKPGSNEARLLFELGLRRHPTIDVLLQVASASTCTSSLRSAALSYLATHFSAFYYLTYPASESRKLPFLPCIKPDGTASLGSPLDVFLNPECAVLGFSVVSSGARDLARDSLKVASDPPGLVIVEALMQSPIADLEQAARAFEYLATRTSLLPDSSLKTLRTAKIVPVRTGSIVRMKRPSDVFFADGTSSGIYRSLFPFVDFGPKANFFLLSCGVKKEPTSVEVAELLVKNPNQFLSAAGSPEAYLEVLRTIGLHFDRLPSSTKQAMMASRILLGSRRVRTKEKKALEAEDEDDWELVYELALASDVLVLDDPVASMLFADRILAAPEETALEQLYLALGTARLSSCVSEDYRQEAPFSDSSKLAVVTKKLVLERIPLFLHERSKTLISLSTLRRSLEVVEVKSLSLKRVLSIPGERMSSVEPSSAAVFVDGKRIRLVVSGAFELELYEVSAALVKILIDAPRPADALLLNTILSTPLAALKRRGFNTERILASKRVERLKEEKALELEKGLVVMAAELEEVFPDCDPAYLHALLRSKTEDHLAQATDSLLTSPYPLRSQQRIPSSPTGQPFEKSSSSILDRREVQTSDTSSSLLSSKPQSKSLLDSLKSFRRSSPSGPSSRLKNFSPSSPLRPSTPPNLDTAVTPTSNIRANVERAVNASRARGNRGEDVVSEQSLQPVKETNDGGYCSLEGAQADLKFVAKESGLEFYVDRSTAEPEELLDNHRAAIIRFVERIVIPLGSVYKLQKSSLHIFFDSAGPLIAFNRSGSLFLNLRYYVEWHDTAVAIGSCDDALTSWFFTIAHELAHNLVAPHNAAHSYYFSAISEQYLAPFTRLLNLAR